jgi:tripartite-type tricarboxylate transporter receptor subunit TctC
MITRRRIGSIVAGGSLASAATTARAQTAYPDRPVRLVVGFPPGQSIDIGARVIASHLSADLGQPVVVDNKPGASGIISHEAVKIAPPDGYTLLMGSGASLAINPGLYRKLPYAPLNDFTAIALINWSPMFLVANKDVPVHNLQEMIEYVQASRGQVSYGSGGSGLTQHIAMEMLKKEAKLDLLHVPYRGSPAVVTDLLAGRVSFAFDTSTSILPHAREGRVRLLAVSSPERSAQAPDVPTLAESGLPGFAALTWAGLVGPAEMPEPIVGRLNAAVNRALKEPEVVKHYRNAGSTIGGGSPDEFRTFMAAEIKRWGEAVAASGAQVD